MWLTLVIKAATARRAEVAKAAEAKAAAERAAKADFEAAVAAKAAAEEARKAEMMAGISAGYDKEAAAIRLVLWNSDSEFSKNYKKNMMVNIRKIHYRAHSRRKPNKRTMKRSKFLVKPDPSEAEETEA